MQIEEREIPVGELRHGMFVCRLDRPWEETPFLLQGFLIESESELATLRRLCRRVWIDIEKGHDREAPAVLVGVAGLGGDAAGGSSPTQAFARELPAARKARDAAMAATRSLLDAASRQHALPTDAVAATVVPVVESVSRSPDAFFWLQALAERDAYHYTHALNCCALAATLARHIGLPTALVNEVATGALMMDIGKAALPAAVFDHPGPLSDTQRDTVRSHVGLSLSLIAKSGLSTPDLDAMVASHHERHDGSGYPEGLRGGRIPLYGRILGLVDTYDAMVSARPHQAAKSRHDVLQYLYRERDSLFQSELVEQFSQCLGVYPTGSLVELNTGEVAVVMNQNPARRLFPRVTVLTRPDKTVDPAFRQVDLLVASANPDPERQLRIVKALPDGAFGLDVSELYL